MLSYLKKILSYDPPAPFVLGESPEEQRQIPQKTKRKRRNKQPQTPAFTLSKRLEDMRDQLEKICGNGENEDLILRIFKAGKKRVLLALIDGLCSKELIGEIVMKPLMYRGCTSLLQAMEEVMPLNDAKEETDPSVVINGMMNGLVFFIVEGEKRFAMLDMRETQGRGVSRPENEKVVHGPQQGFVENIRVNVSLVRNIARTPDLVTKFVSIGGDNGLRGALLYRQGMVDPKLLAKVQQKLLEAQHQTGFVLGENTVARIFERRKYSLFPQALQTERPDRTAAFVMQGHVVLICDGAPYALIVPVTFFGLLHTSEDHYLRPAVATMERMVRLLAMMITVLLPGVYIALLTFHQEVLPTTFMISALTLRKMVGLPVVTEVIITTILFELVREASLRVQGGINQQLGIVGGIVLGEAMVTSNVVSPVVLIVIALTVLSSFAVPDYGLQMALYLLRFAFLALGAMAGLVGIAAGWALLIAYLCTLDSFGVPFFTAFAPATRHTTDLIVKGRRKRRDAPDAVNMGQKR